MADNYIHGSNGLGEAVRANISQDRPIGDMQFITDSVLNFPAKFIGTAATLGSDGYLTDMTVFFGYLAGGIIYIDHFASGYTDHGNITNQVIVIKPTSAWADVVADALSVAGGVVLSPSAPVAPYDGQLWYDTDAPSGLAVILAAIYPVGSIYTNKTDSTNPSVLFGFGTWVAIAGRVVVGYDATQTEFTPAGKTGGHKLLQSHLHSIATEYGAGGGNPSYSPSVGTVLSVAGRNAGTQDRGANPSVIGLTGGGTGENMPPYVVTYVWERTV